MKRVLVAMVCTVGLLACQRELSVEGGQPSKGSLVKDATGSCDQISIGGTYTTATALTDSNFLQVTVNVTTPGLYRLTTDTVNGFHFSGTGSFAAAGQSTVLLKGKGTPLADGTSRLTVRYDSSTCVVPVVVNRSLRDPASFTLTGAPGACLAAAVQGSFIAGYALDTGKLVLGVVVTVPGAYSVSTGTVNGYRFSGTGTFTATGPQTVILYGAGQPVAAGVDAFSVTGAPAGCTVSVTVLATVAVVGTDHFPLSYPSFWVYNRSDYATDSVKRTVVDSTVLAGQVYKKVDEYFPFAGGPLYFRKTGDEYFEYAPVDKYTVSFKYATTLNGEIPFLREGLKSGDTWLSPEYTGTASFGQTILLRYRFVCLEANAAVTVNGNTFANVYKMRLLPEIRSVGNNWGSTTETYDLFYAKGLGLVYSSKILNGFVQYQQSLRRWRVY